MDDKHYKALIITKVIEEHFKELKNVQTNHDKGKYLHNENLMTENIQDSE